MIRLLKDVTERTLPGDFHINRIKRAKEVTSDGIATTYEQLHAQIGLPIAACTMQPITSAANKIANKVLLNNHLPKQE